MITDAQIEAAALAMQNLFAGRTGTNLGIYREYARAALEAAEAAAWQPIETAPSDGSRILVFGGLHTRVKVAYANGSWWRQRASSTSTPTHWRPLPPSPEVAL